MVAPDRRGSARKRGYTHQWEKARELFLRGNPLCLRCQAQGRVTPADVVHHITPHKGDPVLFWDQGNWEPICKPHHDSEAQQVEAVGYSTEVDPLTGLPTDPNHPFNRKR